MLKLTNYDNYINIYVVQKVVLFLIKYGFRTMTTSTALLQVHQDPMANTATKFQDKLAIITIRPQTQQRYKANS